MSPNLFYIDLYGGPLDGETRALRTPVRELSVQSPVTWDSPWNAAASIASVELTEHLYRDSRRYSPRGRHAFTYVGSRSAK